MRALGAGWGPVSACGPILSPETADSVDGMVADTYTILEFAILTTIVKLTIVAKTGKLRSSRYKRRADLTTRAWPGDSG